jgi:hypothetical protein
MRNKNLSSEGQRNSDALVNLVRSRLHDKGKAKSADDQGNIIFVDCNIYTQETLESFVSLSISEFNQTPNFSNFTVENSRFVDCFAEVLVEGAVLYALSSQALLEKGREFRLEDNGIYMDPPAISEMLNTQYRLLLTHHWEKLKHIKLHIQNFDS